MVYFLCYRCFSQQLVEPKKNLGGIETLGQKITLKRKPLRMATRWISYRKRLKRTNESLKYATHSILKFLKSETMDELADVFADALRKLGHKNFYLELEEFPSQDTNAYCPGTETHRTCFPITCEGTNWGFLKFKDPLPPSEQEAISLLCSYFAAARTKLWQKEAIERKSRMGQIIFDIVCNAAKEKGIHDICRKVVQEMSRNTSLPWIDIWEVIDEKTGKTRLVYKSGDASREVIAKVESGKGLVGKAVREKRTLYFPDVIKCPDNIQVSTESRSELDVPIIFDERVLGVLSVGSPKINGFKDEEIELIEILAMHLGVLWAHQNLLEQTKLEALKDPLTGLWNRKFFSDRLQEELSRCKRYNTTFSLVIMDLAGFKHLNDTLGHLEGDNILIEFSKFMEQRIRRSDILARYGGDEFIAILPDTNKTEALKLSFRLKREVKEAFQEELEIPLDVDFGVASFPEDSSDGHKLINTADERLYDAKRKAKLLKKEALTPSVQRILS